MADGERLPAGHFFAGLKRNGYPVIISDPPWSFTTRSEAGQGRSPSQHYRTRALSEIMTDPVADLAAPDCHLFLWTTGPMVAAGMHVEVLKAWGFKPSSLAFVWLKTNDPAAIRYADTWDEVFFMGNGFTTRQNAELVILARRGAPKRIATDVRQVIVTRRWEHSRKPAELRRRVERYTGAKGVELYSRSSGPGWDVWGDEVGKFDVVG